MAGTSRSPRMTARKVGFAPAVTFFSPVILRRLERFDHLGRVLIGAIVEDELRFFGGQFPAHVEDGFGASVVFFLRVFRDRQLDRFVDFQNLSGSDRHEENENGQEHVDHRRDLKFRFARFAAATSSGHDS